MKIILHRVYDHDLPAADMRVLVDRIWPRGIAKAAASWDVWLKDIAPSNELRQWFAHDRAKWKEFEKRYTAELDASEAPLAELLGILAEHSTVVFLYAAKDQDCNNAVVLKAYVESLPQPHGAPAPS
ncbi:MULTISPECIES: DUF488 domain-containing protein [unclassified Desulfovibrio]|uniref:DUF488 domain-containing protein n=1 Tax=unclassified Desulfovibrio TaxID=2593640 RepID=UPI002FD8FC26